MSELLASQTVIEVIYLIASALFILSLKWMSSPATARHGILAGEVGMVLAIAVRCCITASSITSGSSSGWCWARVLAFRWAWCR